MKGFIRGSFNPRLLHDPHTVLRRLNIIYYQTDKKGYWTLPCPIHLSKEDNHTLKLHHIDGHFYCPTCGFQGENILGFYMAVMGKQFNEASKDLGAWE